MSDFTKKVLSIEDIGKKLNDKAKYILMFFEEHPEERIPKGELKDKINYVCYNANRGNVFKTQFAFEEGLAQLEVTLLVETQQDGRAKLVSITPLGLEMIKYLSQQ